MFKIGQIHKKTQVIIPVRLNFLWFELICFTSPYPNSAIMSFKSLMNAHQHTTDIIIVVIYILNSLITSFDKSAGG